MSVEAGRRVHRPSQPFCLSGAAGTLDQLDQAVGNRILILQVRGNSPWTPWHRLINSRSPVMNPSVLRGERQFKAEKTRTGVRIGFKLCNRPLVALWLCIISGLWPRLS